MNILFIVPCFNEASRLNTEAFLEFSIKNPNINFLFVDDGSNDNTLNVLKVLCNNTNNLNFLSLSENKGKAEAIRQGVKSTQNNIKDYTYIGYLDADLSAPLNEIYSFIEVIQKRQPLFILGLRLARLGANINRGLTRHYLGRVFATFVSILLKAPVYDSQCGIKLINSKVVLTLFSEPFISKWLFDVELIARFKTNYPKDLDKIVEHPLQEWNEISGSKLKFKHYVLAPFELFKIWSEYRKAL